MLVSACVSPGKMSKYKEAVFEGIEEQGYFGIGILKKLILTVMDGFEGFRLQ